MNKTVHVDLYDKSLFDYINVREILKNKYELILVSSDRRAVRIHNELIKSVYITTERLQIGEAPEVTFQEKQTEKW